MLSCYLARYISKTKRDFKLLVKDINFKLAGDKTYKLY